MHALLLPATFFGPATFQGKLYDVGTYPAAVPSDDPADHVQGELYALHDPPATLARLDAYEACSPSDPPPHEYVRATVPVTLPTGEVLPAQIYLYGWPVAGLTPVASGDYLRWRSRLT